ncbi:hypothetical protein Spb1_25100 [Planctopirus ephydatiae]|uniref:Uncharacterized protein n=1 Tax=Planctopirus ephydatiae TaxID=2528019 RepID=A0A518GPQ7_9PLAN|nr:hypothetical protein [Planctopirus ephydatiae]QDV30576.1 hypothetical protein Spb1_25100 [Planctopirus ephydatiae]
MTKVSTKKSRSQSVAKSPSGFMDEAAVVMSSLNHQVATILRALGGIKKAGDLERLMDLDRTLSWQLLKIAEAKVPLEAAASVPSRVSINRFIEGSRVRGVNEKLLEGLLSAYNQFETLVERHAGDRVCFNSMVSAAGARDGWHAAELQHRRNVFRGMSHMLGVQAQTLIRCGIIQKSKEQSGVVNLVMVGGLVDLRLLWEIDRVNVFRSRTVGNGPGANHRKGIRRTNLAGTEDLGGYLLQDFCSQPAPDVEMVFGEAGWIYGNLLHGNVGATGESTLFFGVNYRNIPDPTGQEGVVGSRCVMDLPVKSYVTDLLVEPGFADDWEPNVQVLVGGSSSDQPSPPGIERNLPTQLQMENLGTGPSVIREYPGYSSMIRTIATGAGYDIDQYTCWRLRVDYPLYGCEIIGELIDPRRAN